MFKCQVEFCPYFYIQAKVASCTPSAGTFLLHQNKQGQPCLQQTAQR